MLNNTMEYIGNIAIHQKSLGSLYLLLKNGRNKLACISTSKIFGMRSHGIANFFVHKRGKKHPFHLMKIGATTRDTVGRNRKIGHQIRIVLTNENL